jgi:hypothetical protein
MDLPNNIRPPGIYLQSGPPIHLLVITANEDGSLFASRHDLKPEEAAGLGTALLKLAGQMNLIEEMEKRVDAQFLKDAGVTA